ncbi:hypothetical protein [Crocosphaera chwakensis]|uniref:GTPase n=1 Tax=Crocosphaera chwakensis CCY0110 TaxID=391612 RepID=A3IT28_9CHRO|nr:hypothetical protein [Crocosphaera chwakensis]EAZ90332.1 hypothetical protein CY0110_04678 [Crocosphaera chwakensis CCY0110]
MKIIFVYNANSGFINTVLDIGHKIISPETYNCNLCNITYGILKEKEEWKTFRESSDHELKFLHKDEFEKKYKQVREYPTILMSNKNNEFHELINKEQLNKLKSVEELINKLQNSIK